MSSHRLSGKHRPQSLASPRFHAMHFWSNGASRAGYLRRYRKLRRMVTKTVLTQGETMPAKLAFADYAETQHADNASRILSAGLTIRQKEPKNLEAPFDRLDSYLTP